MAVVDSRTRHLSIKVYGDKRRSGIGTIIGTTHIMKLDVAMGVLVGCVGAVVLLGELGNVCLLFAKIKWGSRLGVSLSARGPQYNMSGTNT